jgi:hypothetical protein
VALFFVDRLGRLQIPLVIETTQAMAVNPGLNSGFQKTVDPQTGQK